MFAKSSESSRVLKYLEYAPPPGQIWLSMSERGITQIFNEIFQAIFQLYVLSSFVFWSLRSLHPFHSCLILMVLFQSNN